MLADDGPLTIDVGDARGNAELLADATDRDQLGWALRVTYCQRGTTAPGQRPIRWRLRYSPGGRPRSREKAREKACSEV